MSAAAVAALAASMKTGSRPFADAVVRQMGRDVCYLDKDLNLTTEKNAAIRITNGTLVVCTTLGVCAYLLWLYRNGFLQWDPFGFHNLNLFGTGGKGGIGYSGGWGMLPDVLVQAGKSLPGLNIIAGLRGFY